MKLKKLPLPLISFLQAFLLSLYVLLVGYFMQHIDEVTFGPNFIGIAMMLCLLVLSASISGFLIFGYPVYLLLDKEILIEKNIISSQNTKGKLGMRVYFPNTQLESKQAKESQLWQGLYCHKII